MVGHAASIIFLYFTGLVPNICNNLFKQIKEKSEPGVEYKVTFSMLEIYNEDVRDLLQAPVKGRLKQSLQIRENKDKGFYGVTIFHSYYI